MKVKTMSVERKVIRWGLGGKECKWQRGSRAKAARGSYSQTGEQTHGLALRALGREPRGMSRHEMVLHVTT